MDEAIKNGHGVFITSSICKNADYTQELIVDTLRIIRNDIKYNGYIHAKVMPGTDPLLIKKTGLYANRLSVNIEVAKSEGYARIAKQKNKENIMTPMKQISYFIKEAKAMNRGRYLGFASSQTTQLMAGSTQEDDRTIMILANSLYNKFDLKRVYYTNFAYRYPAKGYDIPLYITPSWRNRRLYQADRLLQLYKFTPDEVTPENQPNLEYDIDPKASWALRNLHLYPIEVNTADYEMLIRIPGIGLTYAKKIIEARKYCTITHEILSKIGVSLKKSIYFIICNGKYKGKKALESLELRHLISDWIEEIK